MKFPLIREQFTVHAKIAIAVLGLCAVGATVVFPDYLKWTNHIFFLSLILTFSLFSRPLNSMEVRFIIMNFVVGVGLFMVAIKTGKLFGDFSFGDGLGFRAGEVPVLAGLLWLIPVLFSFHFTERISENIYLRALLGAVFISVPALFFSYNAPFLDIIHWGELQPPLSSFLVWFVGGFLLHFAGHQMQIRMENPMGFTLYLVWLGFNILLFTFRMVAQ